MIQRKQSIWLFIAALLGAGVLYFDLYRVHNIVNGVDTTTTLRVSDHFPSLLIALVMSVLPLVTIFMFKNRKRQINMILASILSEVAFIAMLLWRVSQMASLQAAPPTSSSYWVGAILPVIAVVFLIMAIAGIRKDEKLVKSVDRLR